MADEPTADDVVDAYIHEYWCHAKYPCPACVSELADRIKALMALVERIEAIK